jgi:HSP20 family protein
MAHATTRRTYGRPWAPRADIYETEEQVVLQIDLPGVKPDQIEIQCEKGMLSIKGERPFSGDVPGRQYYRVENVYGPYERYFEIPRTLDVAKVEAKYQDGVLILTFPKMEEAKPKKIEIKVS